MFHEGEVSPSLWPACLRHRLAIGGCAADAVFLLVNRPLASPSSATPSSCNSPLGDDEPLSRVFNYAVVFENVIRKGRLYHVSRITEKKVKASNRIKATI
ncbi:hypothetical protein KAU04_05895 [bacterium]|nr:hypothetical protein [bacterium]